MSSLSSVTNNTTTWTNQTNKRTQEDSNQVNKKAKSTNESNFNTSIELLDPINNEFMSVMKDFLSKVSGLFNKNREEIENLKSTVAILREEVAQLSGLKTTSKSAHLINLTQDQLAPLRSSQEQMVQEATLPPIDVVLSSVKKSLDSENNKPVFKVPALPTRAREVALSQNLLVEPIIVPFRKASADSQHLFRQGNSLMERKLFSQAADTFNLVPKKDLGYLQARINIAQCKTACGLYTEAFKILQEIEPTISEENHAMLGLCFHIAAQCYRGTGQFAFAIASFNHAVDFCSKFKDEWARRLINACNTYIKECAMHLVNRAPSENSNPELDL